MGFNSTTYARTMRIGDWHVEPETGALRADDGRIERLEPKPMDLLCLLAASAGRVVSREDILQAVWPRVIVGDDTLARAVSRLRRALGDDPREPRYIETLPKRGYRLCASVEVADRVDGTSAVPVGVATDAPVGERTRPQHYWLVASIATGLALAVLAWWLLPSPPDPALPVVSRADDLYFRYSRADNEAAAALYERILQQQPEHPGALAGLANALVQRVMRWPDPPGTSAREFTRLGEALQAGTLEQPAARAELERAEWLARAAVREAPADAAAYKALGLVLSARGNFPDALAAYGQAIEMDPDAWGVLINIADVLELSGHQDEALPYFERAFAAMDRAYASATTRVQPWYVALAIAIGDRYGERGEHAKALAWFERATEHTPWHPLATERSAQMHHALGDTTAARRLCNELERRVGVDKGCRSLLGH